MFPLEVTRQQKSWPEKGRGQIQWLSPPKAAATVKEGSLRDIIRSLQRMLAGPDGLQSALRLAI